MYSANFPRNVVRLPGWSTIIISVISSTVFAGRRIPRFLAGANDRLSTTLCFKQEFTSSPEWNHFWGKASCPGLSCFLKGLKPLLIPLLFFPDSSETAFCDCLLRTAHLVMTMGWYEKGHSQTKWVAAHFICQLKLTLSDSICFTGRWQKQGSRKVKLFFKKLDLTVISQCHVTHHSETSRPLPVYNEWRTSLSLYLIN